MCVKPHRRRHRLVVLANAAICGQRFVLYTAALAGQQRAVQCIEVCYEYPSDPTYVPMKHLYNLDINLHLRRIAAGRNNLLSGANRGIFFNTYWTAEGMSPVHTTSGPARLSIDGQPPRPPRRDHRRPQERHVAVAAWAGRRPIWNLERYPLATCLALPNVTVSVLAR